MAPADLGLLSAGHTLLDAIRLDIPVLVEGYQNVGQDLIRQEETARLEFIDDLPRGDADVASLCSGHQRDNRVAARWRT